MERALLCAFVWFVDLRTMLVLKRGPPKRISFFNPVVKIGYVPFGRLKLDDLSEREQLDRHRGVSVQNIKEFGFHFAHRFGKSSLNGVYGP